jgi:hypothetical protein
MLPARGAFFVLWRGKLLICLSHKQKRIRHEVPSIYFCETFLLGSTLISSYRWF